MTLAEKLLKLVLYAAGGACCLAVGPLFMPRAWMAWTHVQLGMGAFPDAPVAEYLARLTSGLYAFYGGLLLLLARDVRRHASIIAYQTVVIALLAVVGAIYGGMPWFWLAADVVSACGTCAVVLGLQAWIRAEDRRRAGQT
jgi:hypothetical protein